MRDSSSVTRPRQIPETVRSLSVLAPSSGRKSMVTTLRSTLASAKLWRNLLKYRVNLNATIGSKAVVEAVDFEEAREKAIQVMTARLKEVGVRTDLTHIVVTAVEVTHEPEGLRVSRP